MVNSFGDGGRWGNYTRGGRREKGEESSVFITINKNGLYRF
jgi:hypothetical protein